MLQIKIRTKKRFYTVLKSTITTTLQTPLKHINMKKKVNAVH